MQQELARQPNYLEQEKRMQQRMKENFKIKTTNLLKNRLVVFYIV